MIERDPTFRKPVLHYPLGRKAEYIEANSVPILDENGQPVNGQDGNPLYGEK